MGELSGPQRDSRSAVQECCAAGLGVPISQGAIPRGVDRVSAAIKPYDKAIAAQARSAKVHDIDETAWDPHGVCAWLWVMVNTTVALFKGQASRNKAAFAALIEPWAGMLVSAGDGVYCQWVQAWQTCLAHRIRRARGLAERKHLELAWCCRRVLAERPRLVHWATVPPTAGRSRPGMPAWSTGCTSMALGRMEAGKCARTLERELGALWTFVVEHGVAPTHNRAARALRCAVLWRKLMQGSDNEKGDRWVERILSRRESCRLRGTPTFPIRVDAVTCDFNGQQPDVSWI
jgi:transposase